MAVQAHALGGHAEDVDHAYAETRDLRLTGFLIFLVADVVLFSSFVFAYLYLRNTIHTWPPVINGVQLPRFGTDFSALNAVVLFGSGATMHFAMENWKHAHRERFFRWLIATIILGSLFLAGQVYEYTHAQISWAGSAQFGASFFTLTGMHGFHVFVGVIFLIILGLQAMRGVYTASKYMGLTAGTLYWHFVDVIWVFLFFLFYLW